ncbi:hypothetical protein [Chloracidobacterium thermophilum]|uniref:hypothetical protein n=1 Tax=Chloracidobacterium thermophilum TaxID=458033 RepID=UPI0007389679|nr:hypothetical protein [Chloracidobacterium thermophilum]
MEQQELQPVQTHGDAPDDALRADVGQGTSGGIAGENLSNFAKSSGQSAQPGESASVRVGSGHKRLFCVPEKALGDALEKLGGDV